MLRILQGGHTDVATVDQKQEIINLIKDAYMVYEAQNIQGEMQLVERVETVEQVSDEKDYAALFQMVGG